MNLDQHVVLLANYRTGSTNYANSLKKEFKEHKHVFSEPTWNAVQVNDMMLKLKNNEKCIISFKTDQIDSLPIYKELLESNSYKIKLFRLDTLAQITSFYIAHVTKKFHTDIKENKIFEITLEEEEAANVAAKKEYSIEDLKKHCVDQIEFLNKKLDDLPYKWDRVVSYEQLVKDNKLVGGLEKTNNPFNYSEIENSIKHIIYRKRKNMNLEDWFKKPGAFLTTKNPRVESYEIAKTSGTIQTLEGPVKYQPGHYILTGPNNEQYPITPEKFKELKDDMGNGKCKPKQITKMAKLADHNGVIHTSWGDLEYKTGEDFIVRHNEFGDYGVVKKDIFAKTYDMSDMPKSIRSKL